MGTGGKLPPAEEEDTIMAEQSEKNDRPDHTISGTAACTCGEPITIIDIYRGYSQRPVHSKTGVEEC